MTNYKNIVLNNKANIIYGVSLALLLILLKGLELRFLILNPSYEIYSGAMAVIFTALGIWLALKLSKPKTQTVIVEKKVYIEPKENVVINTTLIAELQLSKRELEVLNLLAQGHSNQEMASQLFVSLNTIKAHNQNLFKKLDVKRRIQAVEIARKLHIIA